MITIRTDKKPVHRFEDSNNMQMEKKIIESLNATILLVEDDENIKATLAEILMRAGYVVQTASNGQEALDYIKKRVPDLVISDILMPKMNGFEFIKRIRNMSKTEIVPVIFVTAKTQITDKLEGLEMGADDYITKPFEIKELLLKTKNLIQRKRKLIDLVIHTPKNMNFLSDNDKFMAQVKKLLEANLDNVTLSVPEMASELFISRSTLQKRIKAITGKSVSTYVREYRLKRAQDMLKKGQRNITEVAQKTGFNSTSYFSTSYKLLFGHSPKSFVLKGEHDKK